MKRKLVVSNESVFLLSPSCKAAKQSLLLGAVAQQVYQAMSHQGLGGLDFSAVIKLYQH